MLWQALALLLGMERVLPRISPSAGLSMCEKILALSDGQIRFFGRGSMAIGLVCLILLN